MRIDHRADEDPEESVLQDLARGRVVVLYDPARDQSDLVVAAQFATTETVAFLVRYTSGLLEVALRNDDCARLQLPPMWAFSDVAGASGPTVTVDAKAGVGTGISAADRAATIRAIADPRSGPDDFTRPGHVAPVRARSGPDARGAGPVEALADLLTRAGLPPVGAMATVVSQVDPTRMAGRGESVRFAHRHGLQFMEVQADERTLVGARAEITALHRSKTLHY